jgi:hypothetical protein
VSRPFTREELKSLARDIRESTKNMDGKITGRRTAVVPAFLKKTEPVNFFGLALDLCAGQNIFPETAREAVCSVFFPPVLCAALVASTESCLSEESKLSIEAPAVSFRAAALANLAVRPLESGDPDYSFEWKIGAPVWLPAYKRK